MRTKKGFTLVEILIVVVILGILAAIVIPQFTNASNEARESSLTSNLQALRSQIELFKIQHLNDELPGDDAGTAAEFIADLTGFTLKDGTATTQGTAGARGRYMKNIPANPFSSVALSNGNGTIDYDGTVGDDSAHWHFNSTTGLLSADDSGTNSETSIDHDTY